ncbi:isoleucine--tRNA ligase [archaeon]|nr:isoleucine--tRNA ligase [archaeon]MBL7057012.1 isoleucine--tRNA ligase [Candidatus Woesearchaeota archaeon]
MNESYDFSKVEKEIGAFWKKIDLLKLLEKQNAKGESYFLLDGPPYANYIPHVGHIRNTVYKDAYVRWNFMKGKKVLFQPGFDTHGLPIENMVEKKLKLKSKKDIEKYGIAKFMKTCRESATLNKDLWLDVYDKLGSWYSWKSPYLTYNNSYIESAWWAFKKFWDKGMVYEGKKPVFWCPKCQTALAGYEVTDSYKQMTDPSVYVKFKVKGTKNDFLLVFTTTPWTLPANVAICAHPDKEYVKVETGKGNLILAKNRLTLLKEIDIEYKVLETFKGTKLDGLQYESILDVPVQKELSKNPNALKVYMSIPILKERVASKVAAKKGIKTGDVFEDFVTVEDGSGLVHSAPGHGKTDHEIGKHYNLPNISPLDDACCFTDDAGKYQGEFVKQADHAIMEDMHKAGSLLNFSKIEHSYPVCWRCKSPLIFRLSKQWFLKIEDIRNKMLSANKKVEWQPEFAKERFEAWVSNAEDWNFSRQRYWGIPIPIWKCECGEIKSVGSLKELEKEASGKIPKDFDLHTVNNVMLKCGACKKDMTRINDIFDVWFDSGCSTFASLHYPFENKELFENNYPVSRINESQDQIRGWFYSLMFVGIGVFDKSPYETVSMPGWVLDSKGEKMSKSVGNVVTAKDALKNHGADALRLYYCWDIDPSSTQKFSLETIKTEVSRILNTLWNLHIYLLSQNAKVSSVESKEVEDKWILSRLNTTIREAREQFESFNLHLVGRTIQNFVVDDLSRTYVQLIRNRLDNDKNPLNVINHCVLKIISLMASITPYISEKIYQNLKCLNKLKESVHLEIIPEPGKSDLSLEKAMSVTQEVIAATLACRDKSKMGVRWPLGEVMIDADKKIVENIKPLEALLMKQVNVKKISIGKIKCDFEIKPNFRNIGKEFGTDTGTIAETIAKSKSDIAKTLQTKDSVKVGKFELKKEHFDITQIPPKNTEVSSFKGGQVMLSTLVTNELEVEGFARDTIRRIQQLRKDSGFKKEESIKACINTDVNLSPFKDEIKKKIGATEITIGLDAKKLKYLADKTVRDKKIVVSIDKK